MKSSWNLRETGPRIGNDQFMYIKLKKGRNDANSMKYLGIYTSFNRPNHKNYNFLACDWSKKVLFSSNSLAKLLSNSLLLDSLLLDSLLSHSSTSQSHSKMHKRKN